MTSASEFSQAICARLRGLNDDSAPSAVVANAAYTTHWRVRELLCLSDRMARHGDVTGADLLREQANGLLRMFDACMDTIETVAALPDDYEYSEDDEAEAA